MLLINKVWPLLIIDISKLAPSMFQFWLRPCLDGDKIKQTSYSRGSMDFNDEVRPVYDITKAKQLLVP